MSITVLNPGLLTTVQDLGRVGYQQFGVSVSGVMDPNDDAQWETYLANLEAQGLSQYVATAQTAYTRMTAE